MASGTEGLGRSGVEWRVSVLGGGLAADENGFQGVCDATKAGVSRGLLW